MQSAVMLTDGDGGSACRALLSSSGGVSGWWECGGWVAESADIGGNGVTENAAAGRAKHVRGAGSGKARFPAARLASTLTPESTPKRAPADPLPVL